MNETKPVSILIAALGGEGGGVLADWIIAAATARGYPVQSSSIPGVAQRTGATTYYLELLPIARGELQGRAPVFALTPSPGRVDVVAATELVEAGRVLQNGFTQAGRTTLIASTHREYAVAEKTTPGDGRFDSRRILETVGQLTHRAVLFDMRELALQHGTVINTVLFGAMVASGALPLSRQDGEQAIRQTGKAVDASLRGFQAGFELASQAGLPAPPGSSPLAPAPALDGDAQLAEFPASARGLLAAGVQQLLDYQGRDYADLYLQRMRALCQLALAPSAGSAEAVQETARYLALRMSYEDVIRVADLKTRRSRLERVRSEVGARAGEPLRLTEYLKPGLDEVCSVLPRALGAALHKRLAHRSASLSFGLHVRTDTVLGFAMLCLLRSLRPWRPRTWRYALEQQGIERWLAAIGKCLPVHPELAHELALCGNVVKGYGDTNERGHAALEGILARVSTAAASGPDENLLAQVRAARLHALSHSDVSRPAATPPNTVEKPVRFMPRS